MDVNALLHERGDVLVGSGFELKSHSFFHLDHDHAISSSAMPLPETFEHCEVCSKKQQGTTKLLRCSVCKNRFYCVSISELSKAARVLITLMIIG